MNPTAFSILTLAIYVAIALAVVVRQFKVFGSPSVWCLSRLIRLYTTLMFSQRITSPCPLPIQGPAIIVANHRSPVDPILTFSASLMKQDGYKVRVLEFMTAREYCEIPGVIGWFTRIAGCIPVNRDGKDTGSAKEALRCLQAGKLIGIFPEGGINTGDGLLPFNAGVAWLALRANVPVYPAFIHNAPQRDSLVACFFSPQHVDVTFGLPLDMSRWSGQRLTGDLLEEARRAHATRTRETGRNNSRSL